MKTCSSCAILAVVMLIGACAPAATGQAASAGESGPIETIVSVPLTHTVLAVTGTEEVQLDNRAILAANGMGLELLQRLSAAAAPGTNLFISPVSVALALSMAANGASGDTLSAILETLQLDGWDVDTVNRGLAGLARALDSENLGVELDIANSLWLREGLPFRGSYLDAISAWYDARVSSLDFRSAEAAPTINAWVAERTRDRIPEIVSPPIDPQAILFLINAVYFKGDWQDPFDESATRDLPFTRADATDVTVPMMSRYGSYRYADGRDYQAVRLPYTGDRLSMIVVLPDGDADEWVAQLDGSDWSDLVGSLHRAEGTVVLPRFTLSFESLLNEPLDAMGMGVAMSAATARFDRIHELNQPTWISEVRHKSFVEVNEQGTEAAAVTSVEVRALSAAPREPFRFVADRPFVYAIHDDRTGALVFVGVMHDPLQTEARVYG